MRFRSDPASVRGSIAPVVTPFTAAATSTRTACDRSCGGSSTSGSHGDVDRWVDRRAERADASPSGSRRCAVVAEEVGDRVPFVPGTGSAKLDETLEMTEAAIGLGADIALVITPYYARPTQEGLFAWYSAVATEFPQIADRALQRAGPHRRRRRPRDGRPAAPGPRQHRRHQGDHQGLRALLAGVPPVRARPADVVGHRAAVPAAARARWDRLRQRGGEHRPDGRRRDVRRLGRRRPRAVRSSCTTACTRWSTCCSSRPTRRRSRPCCSAAG